MMTQHQDPPPKKDLLSPNHLLPECCQLQAAALSGLPQLQTCLIPGHVFSQAAHIPQGRGRQL